MPSVAYLVLFQPGRPAPPVTAVPAQTAVRAAAQKPEPAPVVSSVEALPKEEGLHAAGAQSVAPRSPSPSRPEKPYKNAGKAALTSTAAAAPRGEPGEKPAAPATAAAEANASGTPASASARVRVLLDESHRAKVLE